MKIEKGVLKLFLIFIIAGARHAAQGIPFDVTAVKRPASTASSPGEIISRATTEFSKAPPSLELSLSLVAELLRASQLDEPFRNSVSAELHDADVVYGYPSRVETLRSRKIRVVWTVPSIENRSDLLVTSLMQAIHLSFSKDVVNKERWQKASPGERVFLKSHLLSHGAKVLFYQYRLYEVLRNSVDNPEQLRGLFPKEGDLESYYGRLNRKRERFLRHDLFHQIQLTQNRITEWEPPEDDRALTKEIVRHLKEDFSDLDSWFRVNHSTPSLKRTLAIEFALCASIISAGVYSSFSSAPAPAPAAGSPPSPKTISPNRRTSPEGMPTPAEILIDEAIRDATAHPKDRS